MSPHRALPFRHLLDIAHDVLDELPDAKATYAPAKASALLAHLAHYADVEPSPGESPRLQRRRMVAQRASRAVARALEYRLFGEALPDSTRGHSGPGGEAAR